MFGQIIATSHDLTPKGSWGREIPLFQGNLGWWNYNLARMCQLFWSNDTLTLNPTYGLEKVKRMAKATLFTSTGFGVVGAPFHIIYLCNFVHEPFQYSLVMSCQYLFRNSDRSRYWWPFHFFVSESQVSWVEDDEVLSLPPGPWRDVNGLHEAGPAVLLLDRVSTIKRVLFSI